MIRQVTLDSMRGVHVCVYRHCIDVVDFEPTLASSPSTLWAEVTQLECLKPSSPLNPPPKDQISPLAVASMLKYLEAATALTTSPSIPATRERIDQRFRL